MVASSVTVRSSETVRSPAVVEASWVVPVTSRLVEDALVTARFGAVKVVPSKVKVPLCSRAVAPGLVYGMALAVKLPGVSVRPR